MELLLTTSNIMLHLKYLGIFLLFLSGCSFTKESKGIQTIEVSTSKKKKLIDLVNEYHLIKLEYTGPESLVSNIIKLEIEKNTIGILNQEGRSKKSILIFDDSGKFVKRISSIDDIESSLIEDFTFSANGNIIVLDQKNKIFFLSKDNSIIEKFSLNTKSVSIYHKDNRLLSYANGQGFNQQNDNSLFDFSIYNIDDSILVENRFKKLKIPEYSSLVNSRMYGNINQNSEGFLISEFNNDTIFEISNNRFFPKYFIDFGIQAFNKEKFKDLQVEPFSPILTSDFSWGISNPLENENYFLFQYYNKSIPMGIILNKENNSLSQINPLDLLYDENLIPWPKHYKDNYFYGTLGEGDLTPEIFNNNYSTESIMHQVRKHIQEESNPVIFKYTLK